MIHLELLVFLIMGHFIADWIFQSQPTALAKAKNKTIRQMHSIIYGIVATLIATPVLITLSPSYFPAVILGVLIISHFFLDDRKLVAQLMHMKKMTDEDIKDNGWLVITLDQIIHIAIIFLIAVFAFFL